MTAVAARHAVSRRRRLAGQVATAWMLASVLAALVPLAFILGYVAYKGLGLLSWSFFTEPEPFDFSEPGGGFWNGIKGTLKLMVVATALAAPAGLLAALYLAEFGRGRFATAVRFVTDVMTGVPSIFVGIFVYSLIVLETGHFSAWSGAVALAILMLPIVIRGSEEVLKLVPRELREASLALGVSRWRTVFRIVLPAAASGLVTALMLAVARAAGETAPLLFTSFGNRFVTGWSHFDEPDSALPLLIFRDARSAYEPAKQRAWAGALVLIGLVLVLTIAARTLTERRRRARA
ncbi:MAG: phosphate ABC transporter permease PstA [Actinomycetota bacterium]|nr:phosphate ABC transporter permease PstA [Actinomycetota bacterium]